jgi:cytochrome c peroxidase
LGVSLHYSIVLPALCAAALSVVAPTDGFAQASLDDLKASYRRPTEIPFPDDNMYTPEKAALGKALYFDPRLSGAQNMNCATCHNPSFGWEVPVKTAVGAQNKPLDRQAPAVLNQAWGSHAYFWDGRAKTLEEQAKGPIEAPAEMNLPLPEAVRRLKAVPDYDTWFRKVFPDGVTGDTIVKAIATYERTVVSSYAPFDAWIDGDENAISESAKRGFVLFNGAAKCAPCHSGWNFTDNKFHDIGTSTKDIGRGKYEPGNVKAQFAFKTPTLRDIAQRAPYMNDGSFATLSEVMYHYVSGGIERPSRSAKMGPVDLSPEQVEDVIAFLKSLTGSKQVVTLPVLPN